MKLKTSGYSDIAMMTTLEVNLAVEDHILHDKSAVSSGQCQITLLIERVGHVGRTTVLEIFRLLPVDQIVILETRMVSVLDIAGAVLAHERVAVVDVVYECGW